MMTSNLVEVGGEMRPVKYSLGVIKEFQSLTGINALKGLSGLDEPTALIAFIFCGLKGGAFPDKIEFTIDHVGDWIDGKNLEYVSMQCIGVFRDNWSKPTDEKKSSQAKA
jgi:hypothetical protein